MNVEVSILIAIWRSCSWTLRAVLAALKGPVLLTKLLFEMLERIFEYTLLWI
jgi:hypothetical protein